MSPNNIKKKLSFGKKTILKLTGDLAGRVLGGETASCHTYCESCNTVNTVSGGRVCDPTLNVPTSANRRLPIPVTSR